MSIPALFPSLSQQKLNAEVIADTKLAEIIREIRTVKSQEQIDKIIKAQRIAEKGFAHMLDFIKVGRTEKEIQLELDYYMLKNGAEALSFDTIALSGSNTSLPHGVPSDKKVESGEFVLMDFGATYDGWHSDMTRTVCVGKPSDKMESVYETVLTAQLSALDAVKAGMSGKALDKIARDIITEAGYGDNFGHSLGHGVGVEFHEDPWVSFVSEENTGVLMVPGMMFTIEPMVNMGSDEIYTDEIDEWTVRTEDGLPSAQWEVTVLVTETGCEVICW